MGIPQSIPFERDSMYCQVQDGIDKKLLQIKTIFRKYFKDNNIALVCTLPHMHILLILSVLTKLNV